MGVRKQPIVSPSLSPSPIPIVAGTEVTLDGKPHLLVSNSGYSVKYFLNKEGRITTIDLKNIPAPNPIHTINWRDVVGKNNNKSIEYSGMIFTNTYRPTIGSDPEIFVLNEHDVVIPAFEFLPSKSMASAETDERNGGYERNFIGKAFYDGFQAEWTTKAGISCIGFLTDDVRSGMKKVLEEARKVNPNATLTIASVVDLPDNAVSKYDKSYFELGCARSYSAYDEEPLTLSAPELLPYRSAGVHMHFKPMEVGNFNQPEFAPVVIRMIKSMDRILGVALTSLGEGFHDRRRRKLYGRAGEFRCNHTIEYRVPDTIMLSHPTTFNLMWDLGRTAFSLGQKGLDFLWEADEDEVRTCINESDVPLARKILNHNLPMLKRMLEFSYGDYAAQHGVNAIMNGISSVIACPTDVIANWRLNPSDYWISEGKGHADYIDWRQAANSFLRMKEKIR